MNAIDFLKNEHNKVRKILVDIQQGSYKEETRKELFQNLCHNLIRHETMEHKVFYPHLKSKLDKTVQHLLVEEKMAEKRIKEFETIHTPKEWDEKFAKLKRDVEKHAAEEEDKLFPQVEKIFNNAYLEQIGQEMAEFKSKYDERMH